ncbi:prepilin-type N-terminal cleavage/methylation domain-containing protein [Heliobacterium undosum]|uniref:Prepilin-type N-terminal cleavage/methylation domain-containing protein n=2 Tax=Heliomicrobium undosum TaxID=121734 RepID=A0A845L6F3_9FIRM|nr:prepilin-type N-terminal cleavage/methylation domain-containing protein [Heliomicrobium undosum]
MAKAREQKGFSLIELMIVVAIIGVLFAVLVPRLGNSSDRARVAGVRNDFKAFETAIRSYYIEHAAMPSDTDISTNNVLETGRYLDNEIDETNDPWGHVYTYAYTATTTADATVTPNLPAGTRAATIGCAGPANTAGTYRMIIWVDTANNNTLVTSTAGF